jgi:hypothetical protein
MTKTTCGPLYKQALEAFTDRSPKQIRLFAAGFVVGQAEKIYLGACRAAMFRPSKEYQEMLWEHTTTAAALYGLAVMMLDDEIWIVKPEWAASIKSLKDFERNSMAWHKLRARMCGVPEEEIDDQFHLRPGAVERCD